MSVSVVIPHYGKWDLTHELLSDLYRHEKGNIDEIVLVNNGDNSSDVDMGQKYWIEVFKMTNETKVTLINLRENVGFLLAANLGLQEAEGTFKILISNDVRIKGKFVDTVSQILSSRYRRLVGQKLYMTSTGWNNFEGQIFQYLEGFLLAADYRGWDELGYFDTQYAPSDYEDVDISTQALELGYELVPLNLPHIEHLGAGTLGYNPEREKITRINREKFRAKWVEI